MPLGTDRGRSIRALAVAAVLFPLALAAGVLIADSLRLAAHMPAQLNYLDGYSVDDALRLARGEQLYPDPNQPPFTVTVYTPGFFALTAIAVRLGVDPFAAGRLLVLLSMLGATLGIGWSGSRRTGWIGLLVAIALLLNPLQWPWSLVIRPDFTAVLLSVFAVMTASAKPTRFRLIAAMLLCLAAILTKQTAISAPLAIIVTLWIKNGRRMALRWTAVFGLTILISAAALQWASNGQFLFHTVIANTNPFSVDRSIAFFRRFFFTSPLVPVLLVVMLVTAVGKRRMSMAAIYAVLAFATALAVGKAGSSMNYFLEPLWALGLWTALEFPRSWFTSAQPLRISAGALGVTAIAVFSISSWIDQMKMHDAARAALPIHNQVVSAVSAQPSPVVCDDATVLVGSGNRVFYRPFIMAQLAEAGLWDQTPFVNEIRQRRISMIIVRTAPRLVYESRYTEEMRTAIDDNYRLAFSYLLGAPFNVLVPGPEEADSSTVQSGGQGG